MSQAAELQHIRLSGEARAHLCTLFAGSFREAGGRLRVCIRGGIVLRLQSAHLIIIVERSERGILAVLWLVQRDTYSLSVTAKVLVQTK